MSTPISNSTAYATQAEFLLRFDARTAGDLVGDLGVRVTPAALNTDPVLLVMLKEASGMVEAAMFRGDRYAPADILALGPNSLTFNSLEMLKGIVCGIAGWLLFDRRPEFRAKMPLKCQWAMEMLTQLESGERIFAFQEVADAGVAEHQVETPQDVTNRDLIDVQAERYFGVRSNRYLPDGNPSFSTGN